MKLLNCAWCGDQFDATNYHPLQNCICRPCADRFARKYLNDERDYYAEAMAELDAEFPTTENK